MMSGKQKSIFLCFNMEDKTECDLYLKLTEAAGSSASFTSYVKRVLEEYLSVKIEM